jgi:Holliday junction resolvase RusA-like endonuclease
MRSKEYTILMRPMPWIEDREAHPSPSMDNKEYARLAYELSIIRDHNEEKPFNGPVHLEVEFYIKMEKLVSRRKPYTNNFGFPTTDSLVRFLIHAIANTNQVLLHRNQISAITARQYVDKKPRISFRITEMI